MKSDPENHPDNRPLITFALFAYNQERFVREAVEGAFSQTYSPLEIILSDDCSSDRTFEIIQEMAAGYRGPHEIILNRNAKNLGIGDHINRIMRMATGEIIVVAAGDDISYPHRSQIIADTFTADQECMLCYSALEVMSQSGQYLSTIHSRNTTTRPTLPNAIRHWCPGMQGASGAWRRDLFDFFGALHPGTITEDRVMPLRAVLLGKIKYIPESLVRYRVQPESITSISEFSRFDTIDNYFAWTWSTGYHTALNYVRDLETYLLSKKCDRIMAESLIIAKKQVIMTMLAWNFHRNKEIKSRLGIICKWLICTSDIKQIGRFLACHFFPEIYSRKLHKGVVTHT